MEGRLYVPVRYGELEFLMFGELTPRIPRSAERFVDPPALRSLRLGDIGAIPVAWGRSFDSLAFRFGRALPLEGTDGPRPGVAAWELPEQGLEPRYDFLLANVRCSIRSDDPFLAHVEWNGPNGARNLLMEAAHGRILVPLGGDPSWLLYGGTGTLRIGASPDEACGEVEFGEASLLRLER